MVVWCRTSNVRVGFVVGAAYYSCVKIPVPDENLTLCSEVYLQFVYMYKYKYKLLQPRHVLMYKQVHQCCFKTLKVPNPRWVDHRYQYIIVQGGGCWQEWLPVLFFITVGLEKSVTKAAALFDQQAVERMRAVFHDVQQFVQHHPLHHLLQGVPSTWVHAVGLYPLVSDYADLFTSKHLEFYSHTNKYFMFSHLWLWELVVGSHYVCSNFSDS